MYDYWLWDSVLPKWFCENQIKNINWNKKIDGLVGRNFGSVVDKKVRVTDIVWENNASPIGCIAQTYVNIANAQAGWNFILSDVPDIQIGKYSSKNKGFYNWHTDDKLTPNKNGLVRKLSISILLSDENSFEGGIFEFKNFKEQPKLKCGSIIVFPSFIEHRVTPVISGDRYSAVTWVSGPAYR